MNKILFKSNKKSNQTSFTQHKKDTNALFEQNPIDDLSNFVLIP
jgi:hypothetical protein